MQNIVCIALRYSFKLARFLDSIIIICVAPFTVSVCECVFFLVL
jgi:hypothetical protein